LEFGSIRMAKRQTAATDRIAHVDHAHAEPPSPQADVLVGHQEGLAGLDRQAEQGIAEMAMAEQRAEEAGLADAGRAGHERDAARRDEAVPDPRGRRLRANDLVRPGFVNDHWAPRTGETSGSRIGRT